MQLTKTTRKLLIPGLIVLSLAIGTGANSIDQLTKDPRNVSWDLNVDEHKVVGAEACQKCHVSEMNAWKQTPHFETFLTLHRKKEAQAIAGKLGITNFKNDSNCIQCHFTMQQKPSGMEAIAGVSCESCHGAAKDWVNVHQDYGPGASRLTESPEHRFKRLGDSINAGMRNPINVYLVAQSCYRCHTVPDEKLVNVGGHSAGSLDFELVSWSQGLVRHNFIRTDGKENLPSSPERLRLMFVAGMIADLEFSLRSTAVATEKADFGITSAKRAARAADRLKSAQSKLQLPILDEILSVYSGVTLRLKNHDPLVQAADQINQLGIKFAATVSGEPLLAIDAFIPPSNKWK
jgi:Cytochrome c554 and c-prime